MANYYPEDQKMRADIRRHVKKMQAKGVVYRQSDLDELYKNPRNVTEDKFKHDRSRYSSWQRFDDYARIGESVSEVYSQAGTPTKLSKPMTVMASKKGFSGATLNEDLQSMQGRLTKPEALKDLHDMLTKIAGELAGEMPKAGMENEYFTIDKSWKGNQNDLWKHIEFADDIKLTGKLGKTVYQDILDMYTNNPYLKKDSTYEDDWHWKSYVTNAEKIRDQINATLPEEDQMTLEEIMELRDIMNTSEAWKIAAKMGYDSLQEAWRELTLEVQKAKGGDDDLWDEVRRFKRNWDTHQDPANELRNIINNGLKNIAKNHKKR